jgi:SPP1 family phage portal protein
MESTNTENTTFSNKLSAGEITQIIVDKYRESPMIKEIRVADKYYDAHNEEIEKKTRVYYDKDRNPILNPRANNAKIKSNFLRMLVQQKQDYALAKTFILKLSDEKENEIELKDDDYGKEWKKFLDKSLFKISYVLAGQAVNHGLTWCYVWIDENGELRLKDVQADLIYPIWKNRQHTELDKLVYNYKTEKYESLSPTVYEYAEYWDDKERRLFNVTNAYVEETETKDAEGNPIYSHMVDNKGGVSWDKIPFICLKATNDEKTLLSFIKEQIDAYDQLDSRSVDGLVDDLDPILVLKGVSSDVRDLLEARELAKMTRTVSLDTDGDAHYIQAQTPVEAHLQKMESLRRDIIKFGYGIDYEDARFGGNPNQLVIKSLYQNLDTYTDGLERHFQDFINDLKYFFDKWYEFTGKGSFDECQKYKILVKFDRSMMINQSAQIEDTVKLAQTGVSQKTMLEFNPVVQDVELELERIKEEKKENQDNDLFNFAQRTNIENGGEFESEKEEEQKDE